MGDGACPNGSSCPQPPTNMHPNFPIKKAMFLTLVFFSLTMFNAPGHASPPSSRCRGLSILSTRASLPADPIPSRKASYVPHLPLPLRSRTRFTPPCGRPVAIFSPVLPACPGGRQRVFFLSRSHTATVSSVTYHTGHCLHVRVIANRF